MRPQKRHYKIPRDYAVVGEYLKELRDNANLTQREVSMALGYSSAQFISNFERGIALPPLNKMKTLMEMYKGDSNRLIALTLDAERGVLAEVLKKKSNGRPKPREQIGKAQ